MYTFQFKQRRKSPWFRWHCLRRMCIWETKTVPSIILPLHLHLFAYKQLSAPLTTNKRFVRPFVRCLCVCVHRIVNPISDWLVKMKWRNKTLRIKTKLKLKLFGSTIFYRLARSYSVRVCRHKRRSIRNRGSWSVGRLVVELKPIAVDRMCVVAFNSFVSFITWTLTGECDHLWSALESVERPKRSIWNRIKLKCFLEFFVSFNYFVSWSLHAFRSGHWLQCSKRTTKTNSELIQIEARRRG